MKTGKWHGGKGSASRISDIKAYNENYDKIFGKKDQKTKHRDGHEEKNEKNLK